MNGNTAFEKYEDEYQAKYDNIKIPFEPATVVSVVLGKFRNINMGNWDIFDVPDPLFRVTCPVIQQESLRTFETKNIGDDVRSGNINQTFKFVVPKAVGPKQKIPIIVELFDVDPIYNDLIGKQTINASDLEMNMDPLSMTLTFGKKNGELDIIIRKEKRLSPDFRFSLGLCQEEKDFRKKRIPLVHDAMKKVLGRNKGPNNILETPVVSLVCSGGGYRAVTGMCGAMDALNDAGLLDIVTYICGLSGSAWYIGTAYGRREASPDSLSSLHNGIRERFEYNLLTDMIKPSTMSSYCNFVEETYEKNDQPYSFVNYFPGFLVAKQMLADKKEALLSNVASYVEEAKVPYPVMVALHVKDKVKASQFHAYEERSPHEVYLPAYGVGLKPTQEGSLWSKGFIVREKPEFPLDVTLGMTGCAFSVLLHAFIQNGGEQQSDLLEYIEEERLKSGASLDLDELGLKLESDEEIEDDLEDEVIATSFPEGRNEITTGLKLTPTGSNTRTRSKEVEEIAEGLKDNPYILSRYGRTARVNNFAFEVDDVKRYPLNPFGLTERLEGEAKKLVEALGVASYQKKISRTKPVISIADAGILKNVPTDSILRPQRTTDIMIVMDFNDYGSDDKFNYMPLLSAAAHAWQSGLKFPKIDFATIGNLPPKEFLIFPSDDDDCPTVLWFTLSNKNFRNNDDYVPRSRVTLPDGSKRAFRNFDVFGENSFCSSFTFQYSNLNFDRISELMYYNVSSHVQEIKDAVAKAVERKRSRIQRDGEAGST